MKLKLKYQNILDKVKTMNSVTLKKIEINTKNQPKSFTKGVVDSEKKFILKSLEKKYYDRGMGKQSRMVMNALKIQALEDTGLGMGVREYPKHKSEYLRTKARKELYNSEITREVSWKNSPQTEKEGEKEMEMKNQSEFNLFNFTNKNARIKGKDRSFSIRS